MKSDSFYAKRIHPVLSMAVITIVCISIVATLHLSTEERVRINELFFLRRSVLDAALISHNGTTEEVTSLFITSVEEQENYYIATLNDGNRRYVIEYTGPGLWGPIVVMVGFEEDLTTLSGVSIVSQNETPGLGARIEEPWFTQQFSGKIGPFILVEEGTSSQNNHIDAVTGATRTSESFRNIINDAIVEAKMIIRR